MQLGIFAKTFVRSRFEETFDAVKSYGLDCLQFNFSSAGLPTLPESIDRSLALRIRAELEDRSLFMAAISGTCNLIHPDLAQRAQCVGRLQTMIAACRELGTPIVTLCTGTRDPADMWRPHRDNSSPEAWHDLVLSLEALLPAAESQAVTLGVEPEPANVIDSAQRARRLLQEMKSPSLKIVLDAANLLAPHDLARQHQILSEAFDLLGPDIVLAHAKDLKSQGQTESEHRSTTVAVGQGKLDYLHFLSLLEKADFTGPLILHSLAEHEVSSSVAFLRQRLAANPSLPSDG